MTDDIIELLVDSLLAGMKKTTIRYNKGSKVTHTNFHQQSLNQMLLSDFLLVR